MMMITIRVIKYENVENSISNLIDSENSRGTSDLTSQLKREIKTIHTCIQNESSFDFSNKINVFVMAMKVILKWVPE